MDFGSLNQMVKNDRGTYSRQGYQGNNRFWDPETNMPCNQPPWGRIFAIDVNTGEIAWTIADSAHSIPRSAKSCG